MLAGVLFVLLFCASSFEAAAVGAGTGDAGNDNYGAREAQVQFAAITADGRPDKIFDEFSSDKFACDLGSKSLPASAVNDDFCDCADGSDEPTTSACSHVGSAGSYSCPSVKPLPNALIPLSRVGDGVCDCCDGSDESSLERFSSSGSNSSNACPNDCERLASLHMDRIKNISATFTIGVRLRRLYSAAAEGARRSAFEARSAISETEASTQVTLAKLRSDLESEKKALEKLHSDHRYMLRSKMASAFGVSDLSDAQLGELLGALAVACDIDASSLLRKESPEESAVQDHRGDSEFYGGEDDFYGDGPSRGGYNDRFADEAYDEYSVGREPEEVRDDSIEKSDLGDTETGKEIEKCSLMDNIGTRSWASASLSDALGTMCGGAVAPAVPRDVAMDALVSMISKRTLGLELHTLTVSYKGGNRSFFDRPAFPEDVMGLLAASGVCGDKTHSEVWVALEAFCSKEGSNKAYCDRMADLEDFLSQERLMIIATVDDAPLASSVAALTSRLQEMESEFSSIQSSLSMIEKKIAFFEGNEDFYEFSHLYGECYSYNDGKYFYALKFLERVTQSDLGGDQFSGSEDVVHEDPCDAITGTKLGHFANIKSVRAGASIAFLHSPGGGPGDDDYHQLEQEEEEQEEEGQAGRVADQLRPGVSFQLRFEDGDYCGSFGPRSADILVSCGVDNKVISVSEPSTCYYVVEFESPLGCTMPVAEELGIAEYLED